MVHRNVQDKITGGSPRKYSFFFSWKIKTGRTIGQSMGRAEPSRPERSLIKNQKKFFMHRMWYVDTCIEYGDWPRIKEKKFFSYVTVWIHAWANRRTRCGVQSISQETNITVDWLAWRPTWPDFKKVELVLDWTRTEFWRPTLSPVQPQRECPQLGQKRGSLELGWVEAWGLNPSLV